jgi:peptide/nickel transport system substrate-binding protein
VSEGLPWIAGKLETPPASAAAPEEMLTADGWTIGVDGLRARAGQELDFTLSVPNAEPLPAVADELAAQMKMVGIGLNVHLVTPSTFVSSALVSHAFELALGDWDEGPDPDVSSFWRSNAAPPQGFNVSGAATDPFLDRALDSLATLADPQARIMSARDVSRFLTADAPGVFLYTPEEAFVTRVPLRGKAFLIDGGSAARYDTMASWQRA